jgi:hypothetical protein
MRENAWNDFLSGFNRTLSLSSAELDRILSAVKIPLNFVGASPRAGVLEFVPSFEGNTMRNTLAILVVWLGWCAEAALAQNTAPLYLVQTITMDPSVEDKFDHMAVDVKDGRLFLTAPEASLH